MAGVKRFFAEIHEGVATLSGEEFEHARNVLRLSVGDEAILLDGSGKEYYATVAEIGKREMKLDVVRETDGEKEAKEEVTLLFGYLKNADRNEFIVQKAVELGVKKIVCFSSEYSSAYMNDNKLDRLNKVAREATKQCLRSVSPSVEYVDNFEGALRLVADVKNKIFACEFCDKSETDLSSLKGSCAIVVGSEGGFSKEEEAIAKSFGFSEVTLGKRILRAETAAVVLTGVVMFALGELGERV